MRTLGLEKKPARVLNMDDIPLCHSRCSQSEGCEEAVVDESVRRVAMVDVVEIGCADVEPGDAAARLEVNEEDPERLMMTSADNEVVNARTVMNTTKAAKLWSKGTTQLQLLCRCSSMNSTGGEAMLRRAPLSIPIANGGGPRAMALQPEGGMQRQPEA
uniref:Uncharacterized protein n=1 Tax=Oryza rufipogon TaxID=4529 RepID=A0A0E0QHH2_ORYRU